MTLTTAVEYTIDIGEMKKSWRIGNIKKSLLIIRAKIYIRKESLKNLTLTETQNAKEAEENGKKLTWEAWGNGW